MENFEKFCMLVTNGKVLKYRNRKLLTRNRTQNNTKMCSWKKSYIIKSAIFQMLVKLFDEKEQ